MNDIDVISNIISESLLDDNQVLICGNGGSASDCSHLAGELIKSFEGQRPKDKKINIDKEIYEKLEKGFRAISLSSDSAVMTAISNDIGYEYVFAQQVYSLGSKGDVLVSITTSGTSKNCLMAMEVAKAIGMKVILIAGSESPQYNFCDYIWKSKYKETAKAQEEMLRLYHSICRNIDINYKQRRNSV